MIIDGVQAYVTELCFVLGEPVINKSMNCTIDYFHLCSDHPDCMFAAVVG